MVENLKTTRYNDGTSIPNVTDSTAWAALTTGAYCWYKNDVNYKSTYGALYNWYTVNTGKLAPTGWHIPTDAEWTTLTTYVGGDSGKLKEVGTIHWNSFPNTDATNETGFTALPGGERFNDGRFLYIGYYGCWSSSTDNGTNDALYRDMCYGNSRIDRIGDNGGQYGFSVRCVRDF